jgi:phospholipase A1
MTSWFPRVAFTLASALALPVWAQTAAPPTLASCAEIGAAADRLACYDLLAGRATPRAAAPAASAAAPDVSTRLAATEPTNTVAPQPAPSSSLLSKFWELDAGDKRGIFNFTGYQPNFVLPVHMTNHINRAPQSPTQAVVDVPDYRRVEAKLQISLRTQLAQGLVFPGGDLWAGYTQQSFWQVYDSADSRPFRNTDYQPELMYVLATPEPVRYLPFGWQWRYGELALAHQSNGQSDPLSRSWNRVYFGFGLEHGDTSLVVNLQHRLHESLANDNNPDLVHYRGNSDFQLHWTPGAATASLLYRTTPSSFKRGAVQFELTYPVFHDQPNGLRYFLQAFSGYSETLTDYNFRQTSVGAGLSFLQF